MVRSSIIHFILSFRCFRYFLFIFLFVAISSQIGCTIKFESKKPICGDGVLEGEEVCDGTDFGGSTCSQVSNDQDGELKCTADCKLDLSGCHTCGNGQVEGPETCDRDNLGGETCLSRGFYGGDLACSADCLEFDASQCEGFCGDGIINGEEVCDNDALSGQTCVDHGFDSGELGCLDDCSGFDLSGCGVCGDGIVNGAEACDGLDLKGETCGSLGFDSGELDCLEDCSEFDISGCIGCGDGVISGDEVCDGNALGGETCVSQGFDSGELACLDDCSGFDFSECGVCGDGVINGDEECDGDDMGGLSTCADFGCRSDGTVTCSSDCTFDLSACLSNHDEDGDGIDDNCDNCPTYYNTVQADGDSDGIGDFCEYPADQSLFSEIVVYDPFLSDESSWTPTDGSWNYGSDIVAGSFHNTGANYLHDLNFADLPYSVETTFYYQYPLLPGDNYAGVTFASLLDTHYVCSFERRNEELNIWYYPGTGNYVLLETSPVDTSLDESQWRKIHVFYNGTDLSCIYLDETGATLTIDIPEDDLIGGMDGQAGLRVYNERAVFTSYAAYQ